MNVYEFMSASPWLSGWLAMLVVVGFRSCWKVAVQNVIGAHVAIAAFRDVKADNPTRTMRETIETTRKLMQRVQERNQ